MDLECAVAPMPFFSTFLVLLSAMDIQFSAVCRGTWCSEPFHTSTNSTGLLGPISQASSPLHCIYFGPKCSALIDASLVRINDSCLSISVVHPLPSNFSSHSHPRALSTQDRKPATRAKSDRPPSADI
ncbi:hypothetical protein OE88DRAFT_1134300 [Heliocybe sulcata]|uniref:Secreted protein n=1 Tax=Heliocybe sulcata TaxID=5364 RepID=A0A5C3NBX3_9AGAM|nr:hypothetical protein OE88DRAFT_1134300 [Heliocybe sulcata]